MTGEQRNCYICGARKAQYDMEAITRQDLVMWYCNPTKDPECAKSQGRRFEWFAGWRREQGLEPFDQEPGRAADDFTVLAPGRFEFHYQIDGPLFGAIGEDENGETYLRFVTKNL